MTKPTHLFRRTAACCVLTVSAILTPMSIGAQPAQPKARRTPPAYPMRTPDFKNPSLVREAGTTETAAPAASKYSKKAVLFGEAVRWTPDSKRVKPADNLAAASAAVEMQLEDATKAGEKVKDAASRTDAVVAAKPDAVILFTGAADEKANTKDEEFTPALSGLIRRFTGAGIAVFVIPSSPGVGASMIANLRIAATGAGAAFVETGTEIGGRPYFDALGEVKKLGEAATITATTRALGTPAPAGSARISLPADFDTTPTGEIKVAPQTPVVGYMVPPPALKRVDPKSAVLSPGKKGARKRPGVER